MKCTKITALLLASLLLASCENTGNGGLGNLLTKENIGTATGAVGGAWIGSNIGKGKGNIVAIAAGTLLGAQLGRSIGASMDRADMQYYHQTSQQALENSRTGSTSTWSNPDSGNYGSITPTRTYQAGNGLHCREYTQNIYVGGQSEQAVGTACRQPDGTWQIQN